MSEVFAYKNRRERYEVRDDMPYDAINDTDERSRLKKRGGCKGGVQNKKPLNNSEVIPAFSIKPVDDVAFV